MMIMAAAAVVIMMIFLVPTRCLRETNIWYTRKTVWLSQPRVNLQHPWQKLIPSCTLPFTIFGKRTCAFSFPINALNSNEMYVWHFNRTKKKVTYCTRYWNHECISTWRKRKSITNEIRSLRSGQQSKPRKTDSCRTLPLRLALTTEAFRNFSSCSRNTRKMVRYNCYVHYSQFIVPVKVKATGVKPDRQNMLSTGHKH
jgi:hypothetical protein